jgi:hypothetical protein
MKDGSILTGKSIVIDTGNLKVDSARGILTIPVDDVSKIE